MAQQAHIDVSVFPSVCIRRTFSVLRLSKKLLIIFHYLNTVEKKISNDGNQPVVRSFSPTKWMAWIFTLLETDSLNLRSYYCSCIFKSPQKISIDSSLAPRQKDPQFPYSLFYSFLLSPTVLKDIAEQNQS